MCESIDFRQRFGGKYRIEFDEAANNGAGGKRDPWLYLLPCRYGHIYPHSQFLLGVYCDHPRVIKRLATLPRLLEHQSGDSEAIFLFLPEMFDDVAVVVQPKRRRKLSAEHRMALQNGGSAHHFKPKSTVLSAVPDSKERVSRDERHLIGVGVESGSEGRIRPTDRLLAVYCDRHRLFGQLAAIPGVEISQEGDDEAIFTFPHLARTHARGGMI